MQNYDIRYDDKYGQLAQIDVAAEGAGYEPWVNQTLTSVNDSVVRLAVVEGELVDWHSHEHEDEFFLVLEGRLERAGLGVAGRIAIRSCDERYPCSRAAAAVSASAETCSADGRSISGTTPTSLSHA